MPKAYALQIRINSESYFGHWIYNIHWQSSINIFTSAKFNYQKEIFHKTSYALSIYHRYIKQ